MSVLLEKMCCIMANASEKETKLSDRYVMERFASKAD